MIIRRTWKGPEVGTKLNMLWRPVRHHQALKFLRGLTTTGYLLGQTRNLGSLQCPVSRHQPQRISDGLKMVDRIVQTHNLGYGAAHRIVQLGKCYDRLSLWDLFSPLLLLPLYVPVRTMSIPGGPVRILPWSPDFLSRALSSGCPYPCSSPALHLLNGVGSLFLSRCYSHCLFVIPVDSLISSR